MHKLVHRLAMLLGKVCDDTLVEVLLPCHDNVASLETAHLAFVQIGNRQVRRPFRAPIVYHVDDS